MFMPQLRAWLNGKPNCTYEIIGLTELYFRGGLIALNVLEFSSTAKSRVERFNLEYDAGLVKFTEMMSAYAEETPPIPLDIMFCEGSKSPRP